MTIASKPIISSARELPELHSGDRMTREEFHRIYKQMPEGFKAELIGGIVYVASPLKLPHGTTHPALTTALYLYKAGTPGVQVGDNTTILLANDAEPQPDLFLRILPEWGGQSRTTSDEYVAGAPELIVEVAHSSRSIDLHGKRRSYEQYGVLEYLVLCIEERQFRWFDLRGGRDLSADPDGAIRVHAFPGLWIDAAAVLADDATKLVKVLNQGLATPEHAEFVNRLAAARVATK